MSVLWLILFDLDTDLWQMLSEPWMFLAKVKAVVSDQRRAMSSPIDAAKRALEKKPEGRDP